MKKYTKIICLIAAVCLLGTAAFCGFRIYSHYAHESEQEEVFEKIAEVVEQAQTGESETTDVLLTEEETVLAEYGELYLQNTDMVGWLSIAGTNINYPVMQTPNNPNYYLKHNFEKEYSDLGNPNEIDGAYQKAISILYAVAYTLKMSYKTEHKIEGFFEYVVPPLEGFWWQDNVDGIDYADKAAFNWISVIRLPEFITQKDFEWAVETASEKKKLDCSSAEFLTVDEGLCVQIMHIGAFDDEPQTVTLMDEYIAQNGYENDITESRLHHEIYLSDARKVAPEKWKTVIRHPIKRSRQQS